ncbi:hypothetical protein E2P86_00875 [Sphingobacterium psychroaquaticum]|uniref:hypothetical protein n=1 Tax=Sphingobacterium psychroaquaticum TaxID=561061 RepID=UPI001069DE7B|nr:hypothetical protein [Sphingobacterium psychroaquaticum]QBQ39782.1 hypothetical protein E2P86_00875 [Sphingobacterium psychroaquaticum]
MNILKVHKNIIKELGSKEMSEVEEGVLSHVFTGVASILAAGFIYETINNYDKMVEAINDGYNDTRNALKR